MLLPDLPNILNSYRIVLASASANRREILKNAGLDFAQNHFEISPSGFAEDLPKSDFPTSRDYVIKTSEKKLDFKIASIDQNLPKIENDGRPWLIISSDTIISLNETTILEKPQNAIEATEMLKKLRDQKVHQVYTSVWIAIVE